jgi:hypothetical protein
MSFFWIIQWVPVFFKSSDVLSAVWYKKKKKKNFSMKSWCLSPYLPHLPSWLTLELSWDALRRCTGNLGPISFVSNVPSNVCGQPKRTFTMYLHGHGVSVTCVDSGLMRIWIPHLEIIATKCRSQGLQGT